MDRTSAVLDAIVMDAFGSDAIPTHLVTREAIDDVPRAPESRRV